VDAAVAKSLLARIPDAARRALLARATRARLGPKAYFVRAGDQPRCGLLVSGFVRMVRLDEDGHEMTLHWERAGSFIGLTAMLRPPAPTTIQAVVDTVLEFPCSLVRELGESDAKVAWAIAEHATERLRRAIDEIVRYAHGSLRRRIAWRLLEFALHSPPGTPLIAQLTQDDLAQAVGAARPSVARVLKELRDEGSIRSMYGGILILRPEALTPPRSSSRLQTTTG
jgi:CRP-like cAMP-binding protein